MKDLLSNAEIDTLLALFQSEGVPDLIEPARLGDRSVVKSVDLLKPNRLGGGQIRSLVRHLEGAAKMVSETLSDKLRVDLSCECVSVEQMRFQAWLSQLNGPFAIYVLKMEPLEQPVLFCVSTQLLYGAVDRILGGTGRMPKAPTDFTAAEYTVADAFVGPCLNRVCEALSDVVKLSWKIEDRFCNPSMAKILPLQDVVLSSYFQVGGEYLLGDLRLAFPFSALEPHVESLTMDKGFGLKHQPGELKDAVARSVKPVPLELSVCLGTTNIQLNQLLNLRKGDVVPLQTRVGEPFTAPVQGKPKFRGKVGTRGKRLAFQVMELMESS